MKIIRNELYVKPCPFCGYTPTEFGKDIIRNELVTTVIHPWSEDIYCPLGMLVFPLKYWNKRIHEGDPEISDVLIPEDNEYYT